MSDIKRLKEMAQDVTLLYVEDEERLREAILVYLKKIFAHISVATNGLEALEIYKEGSFDIVMSDIQMPYMSGIEMASRIKDINPEQEIIIISAYSDSNYFLEAIGIGISDYIVKPINYTQMNKVFLKSVTRIVHLKENQEYKNRLEEMVSKRTEDILKLQKERDKTFENVLLALVELIEARDTYTGGHSQRVAYYCKLIAQKMNLSEQECELIYRAGILHDIGKIATPDAVLLKPGQLNDLEYKLIQQHVQVGYDLLSKIDMYRDIAEIIVYHHECYDGSGYLKGLKGDEIPPLSRIMIVADAFDAMTTSRIYKSKKDISDAILELKELRAKQFDPAVVDAAVEVLSDIEILDSISQLPTTDIEQERFSYFYKDQVTYAYNSDYLNFILTRNYFEREYICLNVLYIHNFSHYNKIYGWSEGDQFLKRFANYLQDTYPMSMVFRYHGDDFIILTKENLHIDMNQFENLDFFNKDHISISKVSLDLSKIKVQNLQELESLI
jgi:putative nucleotidyltransferase with HDIG domain/diguanylate cyclase (GGDEF)-like protein